MLNYNITSILVSDIIAVALLFAVSVGNAWRMKDNKIENRCLRNMIVLTIISAIVDLVACVLDGNNGAGIKAFLIGLNTWLVVINLVIAYYAVRFLCEHLYGAMKDTFDKLFKVIIAIVAVVSVVNIFTPIVFSINANNQYNREWGGLVVFAIDIIVLIYILYLYFNARQQSGVLRVFPVWVFILPPLAAVVVQMVIPGISVVWAGIAIGISAACASLQNEIMVMDKLTGLYNRSYLDFLEKNIDKSKATYMTGIMIDINDFKSINENYGHSEGDEALIATGKVIKEAVGELGAVLRYASDEFVALVNTHDELTLKLCIENIKKGLDEYNKKSEKPYTLSVSTGYNKLDLVNGTIDEFMNGVDRCLFADKKAFQDAQGGGN